MSLKNTRIEWVSLDFISDRFSYKMQIEYTPYSIQNCVSDIDEFDSAINEIKEIDQVYLDADTSIYVHLPLGSDTGAGYQAAFSIGEINEDLTETIRKRCGADISEYLEELGILCTEN